jgi:hypothetical protein
MSTKAFATEELTLNWSQRSSTLRIRFRRHSMLGSPENGGNPKLAKLREAN